MPEISIQKQRAALTDLVACESFGEPIGDLPKGWKGTSEVVETVRKVYMIIS